MHQDKINCMAYLQALPLAACTPGELEEAARALAALSPEDRDLLAAVQQSPHRLTTFEQFLEFSVNTEYFVLDPEIHRLEDLGWRYLAQHLDVPLSPNLRDAIDPVPFGNQAMREEQGCFTAKGYLTLSGDTWKRKKEKKPTIKEQLEQNFKKRAGRNDPKKSAPER